METQKEESYWQIREASWQEGAEYSEYRAMLQINEAVKNKDWQKSQDLISEFIDNMEAFQRFRIKDCLKNLMYWRIRWYAQAEVRTGETAIEIFKNIDEFGYIFYENPKFGREYIDSIWDESYKDAVDLAKIFTTEIPEKLTWKDIFEFDYPTF